MNKELMFFIIEIISIVVIIFLLCTSVIRYLDAPLVKISSLTGKCVAVEVKGEIKPCSILKNYDYYETVYVKGE